MPNVRDYFAEHRRRIKFYHENSPDELQLSDSDLRKMFSSQRNREQESAKLKAGNAEYSRIIQNLSNKNLSNPEPFEFYQPEFDGYESTRQPSHGIRPVYRKFHVGRTVTSNENVSEEGFPINPRILKIIQDSYPQYLHIVSDLCRPLGTTSAVFADFNKPQVESTPVEKDRKERVLKHVIKRLNAKPYQPIHYVDTQSAKLPLSTGTGYHNRHSYKMKAYAKVLHPEEYSTKTTSKGYFYNAFHEYARTIVHNIKETGFPFNFELSDNPTDAEFDEFISKMNHFLDSYPTLLLLSLIHI